MSDYTEKALEFLYNEFDDLNRIDIEKAFGPVFDSSYWDDVGDMPERKQETERANNVVSHLDKIIEDIPNLANIYTSELRQNISWPVVAQLEELRNLLENTVGMAKIWDKAHTVTGGKNWRAYAVANLIGQAFCDLAQPVTLGNKSDGSGPSTAFGKVVCFIFTTDKRLHNGNTRPHWEKPAISVSASFRHLNG